MWEVFKGPIIHGFEGLIMKGFERPSKNLRASKCSELSGGFERPYRSHEVLYACEILENSQFLVCFQVRGAPGEGQGD